MGYKDAIAQRGQSYEGGGSASPVGFDYVRLITVYGGPKEYKSLPGGSPERIAKMAEHDALTAKYTDFGSYLRMAGEAEARNVQKRQKMTPAQRRKTPPWETLDVPEDELIVKF